MQTASYKADFGLVVDVVMEIRRVRPGGNEHNHGGIIFLTFIITLLDPLGYFSPVGRITEHYLSLPVLLQPIVGLGVVLATLGIGRSSTGIEGKVELFI